MKKCLVILALLALQVSGANLRASAEEDHPTARAVDRYTHRKAAHTVNAVRHTGAHVHNWKRRKGHKIRAWLNNH